MAEFTNEDQGGDTNSGTSEERSFGEVAVREENVGGSDPKPAEQSTEGGTEYAEKTGEETQTPTEGKPAGEEETKPELTEKGTKRDPNPQSAVHQDLANAKRTLSQMEQVLGNPELLAKFMEKQYGVKAQLPAKDGETVTPEVKTYTAADFETLDDVANVVNGIVSNFAKEKERYESEILQLKTGVNSLTAGGEAQRLYQKTSDEASALRSEPELNPKSPDYIEGLETDIAEMYHKLDFDERTGTYKGKFSIKEIGDRVIAAARKAKQKGSLDAQTVVKDKTEGQVRTGSKASRDGGTNESADPADSIAKGISSMFK